MRLTREQQKAYNAENYPASVLTWLNEATDRAYDDFESRSCTNCRFSRSTDINGLEMVNEVFCVSVARCEYKNYCCNKWEQ